MKLLIDDANVQEIERLMKIYPIDGVTTNPTIIARTKKDPKDLLLEIRRIIGKDKLLFVQSVATDAEGIVEDGLAIVECLGENTVVKIPCNTEGLQAIKALSKKGIVCCGTTAYTALQAYLVAHSGAKYVAPYVNRIDNMGFNGVEVVQQMQNILDNHGYDCQIMAASFKNSQQVLELCEYGIGLVTCAPDVIDNFINNPSIDKAVDDFTKNFEAVYGEKTMKDILNS